MKILSILLFTIAMSGIILGQNNSDLINTDEKFSPSGKVEILKGNGNVSKKETGIISGVAYNFSYGKGFGEFVGKKGGNTNTTELENNWLVGCRKDPIDDKKMCFMKRADVGVLVIGNNEYAVIIGRNNAYDSEIAVRIDENQSFKKNARSGFINEESKQIIEQLKKGKQVTSRFQDASDEYKKEDTFNLYGFNEAFQYINWAYSKIK